MNNTIDAFFNDDMNADMRDAKKSERPLIIRAYQIATELDKLPQYPQDKQTYDKVSNISYSLWNEWRNTILPKIHAGEYLNVAQCINLSYQNVDEALEEVYYNFY